MPMLRLALLLITGISLEISFDYLLLAEQGLFISLFLFCISFLFVTVTSYVKDVAWVYRIRAFNGINLSFLIISLGYILTWIYSDKNYPNHFQRYLKAESFLVAKIIKPPLDKEKIVTVVAEVERVINKNRVTGTRGNILINVLRDSTSNCLKYGDKIIFTSKIEEFEKPKNPEEFSFKLYQSFHNIYHRTFLKPKDWTLIKRGEGNIFMAQVYRLREYFLSILSKYFKNKNDFAVASAIMLGYNDYMNGDVTRAYASSGALHVLSVSGLHVGIMFIMLNFLLSGLDNGGRRSQIVKAIIIIVLIWFYACLTGLSPSVLRSAMMFTMIQAGKVLIRNVNTYNIIFSSALVLMLFNPFIITEVGFRLSYLAVLSIIYVQPKISALWVIGIPDKPKFENQKLLLKPIYFLRYDLWWFFLKLVDLAWQIVAVSIAAQIATCPLSLLYFHQFPNLFLLSNLVVIPVSNLVLFLGTGLFAVGSVPLINDLVGFSFASLLGYLNKFIFWIDSIPFALIQGISITMIEMAMLYLLLFLLCWLVEEKRTKILIASLIIVCCLSSYYAYEQISKSYQKQIIVYCAPKQSAIAFIDGRKAFTHFEEKLLHDQSAMLFHVKHHWWACGVKQDSRIMGIQLPIGRLLTFHGNKILVVDSPVVKNDFILTQKLKVDLVVLSHSPKVFLKNLQNLIDFREVVFDSSNKKWKVDYWAQDCEKLKIKCWDVNTQGAYIKNLNHVNI